MSSSSGSDSGSDSSSSGSSSEEEKKVDDSDTKRIPPITERKLQLRHQLSIYQVDEEMFEDDQKYTVTGQTATDVVLPNIREANLKNGAVKQSRQLPNTSNDLAGGFRDTSDSQTMRNFAFN